VIYEDIFRALDAESVRYLVVGGTAVNLYGYVRMTVDLDIMVDLNEENLRKLLIVMEKLNYQPRAPVNPVRNSSGALNPYGIILKCNPAAEHGGIISNWVKPIELMVGEKREEWIKEKGAVVFTFIDLKDPIKHIDIFLRNPIDFEKSYQRRTTIRIRDIPISLVSIDDLMEMKILAGRPRDLEDIHHLRKVKELKERDFHGT
jgi:hypothetical protein